MLFLFKHKTCVYALIIGALVFCAVLIVATLFIFKNDETFKLSAITSNGYECAAIGRDIFKKGGSVADAAIATLFCDGVACPHCLGLGGGFQMTIYRKSDGLVRILDSREVAPKNAYENMFASGHSTTGGLNVATPGEVRGYEELHKVYGSLPWAELIQPTIDLCRKGIYVSEDLALALVKYEKDVRNEPSISEIFVNPETNELLKQGDTVKRLQLAKTLETIAKEGANALYNGSLTHQFINDIRAANGILTVEDMNEFRPRWREPVKLNFGNNYTLYTSKFPGSGYPLSFIINALQDWAFKPGDKESIDSVQHWQRVIEVFKYAYAKRTGLGDPDFLPTDYFKPIIANLTSKDFAKHIRSLISDNMTHNDWKHYGAMFSLTEDHGTGNVCVLAPNGDAIAVTSTINDIFGAFFISPSTGIIPNNQMNDFSYPDRTNIYGVPPSPANYLRPGKKPQSSTVPSVIIQKDKGVRLIIGGAGGTKVTSQVSLVILKHLISGVPLSKAMDEPRLHHQLFPMVVQHEVDFNKDVLEGLKKIGHNLKELPPGMDFAEITAISVDFENGVIFPKFDKRRIGSVAGF